MKIICLLEIEIGAQMLLDNRNKLKKMKRPLSQDITVLYVSKPFHAMTLDLIVL